MSLAARKQIEQQEARSERRSSKTLLLSLVSKASGETIQTFLWNTSNPIALGHPMKWVLESTKDESIRVRYVAQSIKLSQKTVFETKIKNNETEIELPAYGDEKKLSVRIKKTENLLPIDAAEAASFEVVSEPSDEIVRITQRTNDRIVDTKNIHGYYHATRGKLGLFRVKRKNNKYILVSEIENLRITNDGSTHHLKSEEIFTLSGNNHVLVESDSSSWTLHIHSRSDLRIPFAQQTLDPESAWFNSSLKYVGSSLAALLLMIQFIPLKDKEEEIKKEKISRVVLTQSFKKLPQASSSNSTSAAPAKAVAQKKIQKVAKARPKRPSRAQARVRRARSLQHSISGLLKGGMKNLMAQSNLVKTSRKSRNSPQDLLDSTKSLRKKSDLMNVLNSKSASNTKVAALGSKLGGKGYGTSQNINVKGKGNGFIALGNDGMNIEEGLTKDEVGRVIHKHLAEIRYCYESSMLRNPNVQGKLLVDFTINKNGIVKRSKVKSSTVRGSRLDDCLLRRLAKWRFPKPKGGVTVAVTYPFIFKTLGK